MESETEQAPSPKGKRLSKLERLRAQGTWVSVDIGEGQTVPYFALPTPELQSEWNETLESWIKKELKANGSELIHATRREHPFHSDLLRERIDELASVLSPDFNTDLDRQAVREIYEDLAQHLGPISEEKKSRRAWAEAFGKYRQFLRDPNWWSGTYVDRIINPKDGLPLPDGPPPKPVYVRQNHDVILGLRGNVVELWIRCGLGSA